MIKLQTFSDKTAIGLSVLCAFHCIALPLILVSFPSIAALQLDNEAFHLWMIIVVLPISVYALTLGCKQHKRAQVLAMGLLGLFFLALAIVLPEPFIGETGEKMLTLIGAMIIAFAHFKNYRLCRREHSCCFNVNDDT